MNNLLPTPIDAVRTYVRAASLSTLRNAVALGGAEVGALCSISVDVVERACFDPEFRVWSAKTAIAGALVDGGAALELLTSDRAQTRAITYLPKSSSLVDIVGPQGECLTSDIAAVRRAWMSARAVFRELRLFSLEQIVGAVDLVAGFLGPRGEIRALSNPLFPGFVGIGINAPPLIVAEQALHESMHVVLSAHLALDDGLAGLLDESVGILSPFTNSVRTIERVVHGIASYSVVGALWRAAADSPTLADLLEIPDSDTARRIVERRLETIDALLRLAMRGLYDSAGMETCSIASRFIEEVSGEAVALAQYRKFNNLNTVDSATYPEDLSGLSAIQRAEVTMACLGAKASRISVPLNAIALVAYPLQSRVAVVCSSWAIRSVTDPKINGFSNMSLGSKHILDAESDDEVHLYLHACALIARKAAILDSQDQAGELFEIPVCCQEWYERAWPQARNNGGDLFAEMARASARDGRLVVASECDASAMYRGGGLCWHFPCSPTCEETVRTIRERRQLLSVTDPDLVCELEDAARQAITILADGSYHDGVLGGLGSIVITFEQRERKP